MIILILLCVLCACSNTAKEDNPKDTTAYSVDYTDFMDSKLISYLDYFNMPRSEVEDMAVSMEDNNYYLGDVMFLDKKCQAIAKYGSGENQWSDYDTLYWIEIIGFATNEIEEVKEQLETVMHTTADQYGSGEQYLFNVDIPNTEYWIHAEESYKNDDTLLLSIHYGHTYDESSTSDNDAAHINTESDVGNIHICEVDGCNNVGTESIIGFSGELEWYCTKHYDEMVEIVDHMLNGN